MVNRKCSRITCEGTHLILESIMGRGREQWDDGGEIEEREIVRKAGFYHHGSFETGSDTRDDFNQDREQMR
jgi:hypothetical protein